jgi:hypothetical protein
VAYDAPEARGLTRIECTDWERDAEGRTVTEFAVNCH